MTDSPYSADRRSDSVRTCDRCGFVENSLAHEANCGTASADSGVEGPSLPCTVPINRQFKTWCGQRRPCPIHEDREEATSGDD